MVAPAFVLLAAGARLDIPDDIGIHPRPPGVTTGELNSPILPEVAGDFRIVLGSQDLCDQSFWSPQPSLPIGDAVFLCEGAVVIAATPSTVGPAGQ